MAVENRTGFVGLGFKEKAVQTLRTHRKLTSGIGAAAAGYIMACSYIFGGVSPFGVAFCATVDAPYRMFAALGAVLGYTFRASPLTNMKYIAAILMVLVLKWMVGDRYAGRFSTALSTIVSLIALGLSGVVVALVSDATLYDGMLILAEVFLGAGAAYFFSRTSAAFQSGWGGANRSDLSCLIVSFAVIIMGLSSITFQDVSVGRVVSVLVVLLCARAGNEAGGAISGITAGIAVGMCEGDYSYAIAAYGFGGLMAGVFAGLGRISTAGAFILVNALSAVMTKSTGDMYTALIEIFIASVLFAATPQSVMAHFKIARLDRTLENERLAQGALKGRLSDISDVLRSIGITTREVGQRLGKLEQNNLGTVYNKVADRVCVHCGMKTTCWEFRYSDTMNAMNDAILILKREGTINRERIPKYFAETCCKLDHFVGELNTQFGGHVSREKVQRKVSRVREVVNDQFEGLAMMLEEISGDLCSAKLLDPRSLRMVQEYFVKSGYLVEQVRCFTDEYERITAEVMIPAFEVAKLDAPKTATELSAVLEAEFDLPYVEAHEKTATIVYTEKATFTTEMGVYQICPEGNKLCGDAYASIRNRSGRGHFIISDGMGSGGSAAVDSHMATDLLTSLIAVGFGYEAALKMVNSALLIKSGEETLATIDICSIDLYTGQTDFYKAGAAPTFVVHKGHIGYVESTSLPAGILQGVAFDHSTLNLREGDIVVMVSDGVVATGMDWVKSELRALAEGDMQRLAEKLAMTARVRRTDGREDDITVVAILIRKGI